MPSIEHKTQEFNLKPAFWLIVLTAYVISGKLGLMLALAPGYASPIFPPAGIAVAVALIAGKKILPWLFVAAFLVNIWIAPGSAINSTAVMMAVIIAIASTLQAAAGGWGLRKLIGYPTALDNGADILRFLLLSPVICLISASLSVFSLWLSGMVDEAGFASNWAAWWIGDTLGVIVMLPLVMSVAAEPRVLWRRRIVAVSVPILLIFIVFIAAYLRVNQWEYNDSLSDFRQYSQHTVNQVQTKLEEQESLLEQMTSLFIHNTRSHISREEYQRFVQKSLARFPMIKALEWAPVVRGQDRIGFEAGQRNSLPDFEIRERDDAGVLHAAGQRDRYCPVTYVEPLSGNEAAAGFDLMSNPQRNAALSRAMETGRTVASASVKLVQESQNQAGILLLMAIDPKDPQAGVVLTVLRMGDFMDKLLPDVRTMIYARLIDLDEQKTLYNNFLQPQASALFEQDFSFGTRRYRLETAPTPGYFSQHRGWQSWGLLTFALLATGLMGGMLLLGTGYTARIEAQVADRTAKLKASEERWKFALEGAGDGVWERDLQTDEIRVSKRFEEMLGFGEGEFGNRRESWLNRIHPDDRASAISTLQAYLEGRAEVYFNEYRLMCRDGSYKWVLARGMRVGQDGKSQRLIGTLSDISARKLAEQILKSSEAARKLSEAQMAASQQVGGTGSWVYDIATNGIHASANSLALFGFPPGRDDYPLDEFLKCITERERVGRALADAIAQGEKYDVEFVVHPADGAQSRIIRSIGSLENNEQGKPFRVVGFIQDVTERKQAEIALQESEARFRIMADSAPVLIWLAGADKLCYWFNKTWLAFTGRTLEQETGNGWTDGVHPDDLARCVDIYVSHFDRRVPFRMEYRLRHHSGEYRWIDDQGVPRINSNGDFEGYIGSCIDVTERRENEQLVLHLAHYDALTGLANRALFMDRLQQSLFIAHRERQRMAIMFIDLDKFKPVNDEFGHQVGDLLLKEAANRMTACVRESDSIARIGGDEFIALLPAIDAPTDALRVAEKIRHELSRPFMLAGLNLGISSSIGVAVYPEHGVSETELMNNADNAMYLAKAGGRNRVCLYAPE